MMKAVLFTKLFRGVSLDEAGAFTQQLGFDGVDLLVRPGHQLDPNTADRIPGAVRRLEAIGLGVPMVTTDLTDPSRYPAENVLGNCSEAGVRLIRLGYWKYEPERGFAAILQEARRQLDALEEMAQRYGVRLALQLHGGTIHSSGALAAQLLGGHDPMCVGAYPDPGNQVVQEGREDWRLTFELLRPWLCCVGVKNGGWFSDRIDPAGQRRWWSDFLGIADGMVPWRDIISHLVRSGFDGLCSFHSHYEVPLPQALDQTRSDLGFFRRVASMQREENR
jgi:sugar phosphate isomerase/epimerase